MREWCASLRVRLLLLVLLTLLPVLGLLLRASVERHRNEAAEAQRDAVRVVGLATRQHEQSIESARHLLLALTQLPAVQTRNGAACSVFFANLMRQYPVYTNLTAAKPNGEVFCSALPLRSQLNFAGREWYQRLLQTEEFVIGEYELGRVSGKPTVILAQPLRSPTGQLQGLVTLGLDLTWLNGLAASAQLPQGANLFVIDRSGTVVIHHPDSAAWVGRSLPEALVVKAVLAHGGEGTADLPGLDEVRRLYAFKRLGGTPQRDLTVAVGIPTAVAMAGTYRMLVQGLLWLGVVAVAALGAAWVVANRFVLRPVNALLETTRRLTAGDLTARTGLPAGGELGHLAHALDQMAEAAERHLADLWRARGALQESEARFRLMVEGVTDYAIVMLDAQGHVVNWNAGAQRIKGYTPEEVVGQHFSCFYPAEDRANGKPAVTLETARTEGRFGDEGWRVRKDGSRFWANMVLTAVRDSHGEVMGFSKITRDLSERRQAEEALGRTNRALRMISLCNQFLVRARDEGELLGGVCRILVDHGGYRLAWVGYAEKDEEKTVRPVASHGFEEGYLSTARVSWADSERGNGPMGRAIRTGVPCHVHHVQTDPTFGPWREEATRRRYASVVALPLREDTGIFGGLIIYAGEVGAFDGAETNLLMELADDLAYGIRALHTAADRARAEAALARRTRQLEAIQTITAEITRELDLTALLKLIHRRAAELVGATARTIYLWDEAAQVLIPRTWPDVEGWIGNVRLRLGEGVAGTVAQRREGMIVNDFRTSPYVVPLVLEQTGVTAILAEPLAYHDRLVGVITIAKEGDSAGFTEGDRQLLALFADHAAIAIENARLYEAAQRHTADLEARVQARTAELAAANRELQAASRHKSEFLANMSHELRTPLNSILGFAQLLLEQTKDLLSTKQTRFLTNVHKSGQHLLQLINDILDLSKVEAGKFVLQPEPLPVAETLEDILVIARGLANKKGQTVDTQVEPGLPPLHADPVRFKQVLFNLLSNAVKFTPDGGRIILSARRVPGAVEGVADGSSPLEDTSPRPSGKSDEALEIRVIDAGIGIRAEDLPRLFQEFVQLETTQAQRHEGSGLGLALTKRLVEMHGGSIAAESAGEGQGSTFTVRLPFQGSEKAEE